jgi:hypothetical protein
MSTIPIPLIYYAAWQLCEYSACRSFAGGHERVLFLGPSNITPVTSGDIAFLAVTAVHQKNKCTAAGVAAR